MPDPCSHVGPSRHELRLAATEALWRKRSMLPEHTEEIVDDVLDAILPLFEPYEPPILSDGFPGGFPSDGLVEAYYRKGPPR